MVRNPTQVESVYKRYLNEFLYGVQGSVLIVKEGLYILQGSFTATEK